MKRSLKYLSLLVAAILVVTGCNLKTDPEKQLKEAIEKTSKATSVNEKINAEVSMKEDGKDVSLNLEGDFDEYMESEEKGALHGNLKLSSQGMSYSVEGYADIDKNIFGAYLNVAGTWIKFENKIDEEEFNKVIEQYKDKFNTKDGDEFMKLVKEVKTEKTEEKGTTKLVVVFDKDKINSEIKDTFSKVKEEAMKEITDAEDKKDAEEEISEFEEIINKGILSDNISCNIYLKDGYISKFEFDMTNLINSIQKSFNLDKDKLKEFEAAELKAKITIELTKYDKVEKITIPDAAKNGKNFEDLMNDENTSSLLGSFLGM